MVLEPVSVAAAAAPVSTPQPGIPSRQLDEEVVAGTPFPSAADSAIHIVATERLRAVWADPLGVKRGLSQLLHVASVAEIAE